MPKTLPLYRERPKAPVETVSAESPDSSCRKCALGYKNVKTVGMKPETTGGLGGLLVVTDYPGATEDNLGRPFASQAARQLRPAIRKLWDGAITLDSAVKCRGRGELEYLQGCAEKCRPHLAHTIEACRPSRIIAMGKLAIWGLLGRRLDPLDVRQGYGWVDVDGEAVPVYMMSRPEVALVNRFRRRDFDADLELALTQEPMFGPPWAGKLHLVTTLEDALQVERDVEEAGWFSFDIESAGKLFAPFQVLVLGMWNDMWGDDVWAFADHALEGDPLILEVLLRILENPAIRKVGANVKYDELGVLCDLGGRTANVTGDTRLLRKLLDNEASGYLETMAELVGMGGHKKEAQDALASAVRVVAKIAKDNVSNQMALFKDLVVASSYANKLLAQSGLGYAEGLRADVSASIKPGQRTKIWAYGVMPRDICVRYNGVDALSTGRLDLLLEGKVQAEPDLLRTYRETVMPAAAAVRQMEEWGINADREAVEMFHTYLSGQLVDAKTQLEAISWRGFNANAYDDVRKLLYDDLKLPVEFQTDKGKPAVHADALDGLRGKSPAVAKILEVRRLVKLDGTYALGMLPHIREDGRIHANIKLDGTGTGRPSCTDPNLQTIPRDGDSAEGKMARDCFTAPLGHDLISADYSQVELRVAADLSKDPVMISLFQSGVDFHLATAEFIAPTVWGVDISIMSPKQQKPYRTKAKSFNFGVLYGMSDAGIAHRAGCTLQEAGKIREAIMGRFSRLAEWIREQLIYTKRTGYTWTWWNGQRARRRALFDIASSDRRKQSTAINASCNTPVQGSASEYLVRSMTEVISWIVDNGIPAKVVLPVHDALIVESRKDCTEEVMYEVHRIMTQWGCGDVPLVVDLEKGPAWGSLEKVQLAA